MKFLIKIPFLLSFVLLTSCFKDVDFKQAEDIELSPTHVISLMNLNVPQTNLLEVDRSVTISQETIIPVINSERSRNSLSKIVLEFKINNTFNRDVRLKFNLTDAKGLVTYDPIIVDLSKKQTDFTYLEDIAIVNNPDFLNTEKVTLEVTVFPNPDGAADTIQGNEFDFKSAVTLFFTTK